MDPKFIIVDAGGGFCNKLFAIISGLYIAKHTNRKMIIIWNNQHGCNLPFQKIFDNNFVVINTYTSDCTMTEEDTSDEYILDKLKYDSDNNIQILKLFNLEAKNYSTDYNNKLKSLLNNYDNIKNYHHYDDEYNNAIKMRKGKCGESNWLEYNVDLNDFKSEEELIIKFSETVLPPYITLNEAKEIMQTLKLKKNIQDKIDSLIETIGINKDVIGIHERRTDFLHNKDDIENKDINLYNNINYIISNNFSQKIFLATDDIHLREDCVRRFPNNIIIYKQSAEPIFKGSTSYYSGFNELCNNSKMERSGEFVINGVIDLYLLGSTTFKEEYNLTNDYYCYKFSSTYALMAKILSLI